MAEAQPTLLLTPWPQSINLLDIEIAVPDCIMLNDNSIDTLELGRIKKDLEEIAGISIADNGLPLNLEADEELPEEAYRLSVHKNGIILKASSDAGLFYGMQTLLQLLTLNGKSIPAMEIEDFPRYAVRELMIDMGRAVFKLDYIKRIIRVLARLKMNTLHLHLYDDQLNSVRFNDLPLGSENPHALGIEDLALIIDYARRWHVSIVPELEGWGHAGSILHHYPDLYGGPGMWEGFSFGIGESLYDLLKQMTDQIVSIMPDEFDLHYGLDEATWALLPDVEDDSLYSPELHVGRLNDILMESAAAHGKKARMRIWADHGGRPVPEAIRDKVVTEPWQYHECRSEDIKAKVKKMGGAEKPPIMLGGGMSSVHFSGHFGATRTWCREGDKHSNVEGVDICLWETNDIAAHMLGIFAGADLAWTPQQPLYYDDENKDDPYKEKTMGIVGQKMIKWQSVFTDASPSGLYADMGDFVYRGLYVDGPDHGKPVAPTALLPNPRGEDSIGE